MEMSESIKTVFEQVHAETDLKENTKAYIARQYREEPKHKTSSVRYMKYAIACVCIILISLTAHRVYFTATSKISIDINPSIELSVNRFNQVISVNSYNDDGKELAKQLNVRYQNYDDAIQAIVKNEIIAELLADDELITFTVAGSDSGQANKILSELKAETADQENTYCYHASNKDVQKAHEAGLSFGKYRAYLELKKLDPTIEADFISQMTMREIHDLIHEHSQDNTDTNKSTSGNAHHGHNGNGHGNKNGKGKHRNSE